MGTLVNRSFSPWRFISSWLYTGRECYAEASTTSNSNESNVKLLTTAAIVDNLAKKVDECPLNRDRLVLFAYNWDRESCLLCGVVTCPLFRGCLSIEVNGRTVGIFGIVRYIWVSAFEGCQLSGVGSTPRAKRKCVYSHFWTSEMPSYRACVFAVQTIESFFYVYE